MSFLRRINAAVRGLQTNDSNVSVSARIQGVVAMIDEIEVCRVCFFIFAHF